MTKEKKSAKEIKDTDLDQVQGGATAYIGETEKNLSGKLKPKSSPTHLRDKGGVVASGGGSDI